MASRSESTQKQADDLMNEAAFEFRDKATNKKTQLKLLNGISGNMDSRQRELKILLNTIDHLIELKYKKNQQGLYIVGDNIMNKDELSVYLMKTQQKVIKDIRRTLESQIDSDINISKIKLNISKDRQERIVSKETKKNIKNQWNQLSKHLNNQNRKFIDAVYKQGRIESAMRSQQNQAKFQKHNISSKFMSIKHNFKMAMNKMNMQNIFNESRIHTAYKHRSMINHHNNKLNFRILGLEQEDADEKAKLELMKQRIKLLQKQLAENQALKDDMKQSISNMINMIEQAGQNLREKTKQEQEQLAKDFQKLANEIGKGIQKLGKDFDRDAKQFMNDIIKQLQIDRDLEKQWHDIINGNFGKANAIDQDIWKLEPPVVNPITKMPPSCGNTLPGNCMGSVWLENASNWRNINSKVENITIYRCDAGGHYCASDGGVGSWGDHKSIYETYT